MTTFYLWKDKSSTSDTVLVYITDYKTIRADGMVWTDRHGWVNAELIHESTNKNECILKAQELLKNSD